MHFSYNVNYDYSKRIGFSRHFKLMKSLFLKGSLARMIKGKKYRSKEPKFGLKLS